MPRTTPPPERVNVVLQARIIDPFSQVELGQFKTVQSVEVAAGEAMTQAIEYALEICDPAKDWLVGR